MSLLGPLALDVAAQQIRVRSRMQVHARLMYFTPLFTITWFRKKAGGPPLMIFHVRHSNRGCPILAFFARVGSDAACATGLVTTQPGSTNLRLHSRLPPFVNCAKDGAPDSGRCQRHQSLGHPPSRLQRQLVDA